MSDTKNPKNSKVTSITIHPRFMQLVMDRLQEQFNAENSMKPKEFAIYVAQEVEYVLRNELDDLEVIPVSGHNISTEFQSYKFRKKLDSAIEDMAYAAAFTATRVPAQLRYLTNKDELLPPVPEAREKLVEKMAVFLQHCIDEATPYTGRSKASPEEIREHAEIYAKTVEDITRAAVQEVNKITRLPGGRD